MKRYLTELSLGAALAVNKAIVNSANQRYRDALKYNKECINLIAMFDLFYKLPGNERISEMATMLTGEIDYNNLIDLSDIMTAAHNVYTNAATCGIINTKDITKEEFLEESKRCESMALTELYNHPEATEFDIAFISVMLCTWLTIISSGELVKNFAEILENQINFLRDIRRFGNIEGQTKYMMQDIFKKYQEDLDWYSKKLDEEKGANDEI